MNERPQVSGLAAGDRHAQRRVGWQSSPGWRRVPASEHPKSTGEENISQPAPPPDGEPAARPGGRETESEERRHARCSTHALATGTHVCGTDTAREVTRGARQGPWLVKGQRKGWAGNATSPGQHPKSAGAQDAWGRSTEAPGEGAGPGTWAHMHTHTRAHPVPGHRRPAGQTAHHGNRAAPSERHHRLEGSEAPGDGEAALTKAQPSSLAGGPRADPQAHARQAPR